jgi:hypothetical protein
MPVTTRSGSANNNPIIVGMAAATASALEEEVEVSTTANAAGAVKSVASIAVRLFEAVNTDISSTKRNIVRVVIPNKNFTSEDLSKCIQQVIITAYSSDDTLLLDRIGYLSGLYLESDSTFVPFSHIFSHIDSYTQETFCFKLPSTSSTSIQHPSSFYHKMFRYRKLFHPLFFFVSGPILGGYCLFYNRGQVGIVCRLNETRHQASQHLLAFFGQFWSFVTHGLVDGSLRAIYRYGPSSVGWEGVSLPKICSRVTFYGTEEFWMKNYDECLSIYDSKEISFLAFTRPLVLMLLLCLIIILLVVIARRRPQPIDPNMEETFRSIQMLARQLKRAFVMAG